MKETQGLIFAKLRAAIAGEEFRAIELNGPRWIKGDELDAEALQRATIVVSARVSNFGILSVLRHAGSAFLVLPGELGTSAIPDLVEGTEQRPGLLALMLSDGQVLPSVEPLVILDAVFGRTGEFTIDEILPLFGDPVLLQFTPQHVHKKPAELLSLAQAASAHQMLERNCPGWFGNSKTIFQEICRGDAGRFAGDALLSASTARESHHAFLQLYRAFEGLFRVMLIQSFAAKVKGHISQHMSEISQALNEELTWRMRDDVALSKLVGTVDPLEVSRIANLLRVKPEKVSKTLYDARNRVAHGSILYRPPSLGPDFLEACLLLLRQAFAVVAVAESWIPDTLAS